METATMQKLTRDQLMSLEQYAKARNEFRAKVMAHKKNRQVHIGPNATLYFEDRLTIHYQVQEMLRAERIFEEAGITAAPTTLAELRSVAEQIKAANIPGVEQPLVMGMDSWFFELFLTGEMTHHSVLDALAGGCDVILAGPPWQAWRAPTWAEINAAEAKEKAETKQP